jgi:hypothetical protein
MLATVLRERSNQTNIHVTEESTQLLPLQKWASQPLLKTIVGRPNFFPTKYCTS